MIDLSRFLVKYRWFLTIIGLLLLVQFFLAVRLVIYHNNYEDPDGSGPRSFKWSGGSRYSDATGSNDDGLQKNLKNDHDTVKVGQTGSPVLDTTTPPSPVLDLSTLDFLPRCNITLKESVSAISRAKTQSCKKQLVEKACKIIDDNLYRKALPRFCTNNVTSFGKYHGCYKDDKKKRILPDFFLMLKHNSPQACTELCLQSGYQYAGVQYSVECFCGNSLPSHSFQLQPSSCDMKCPEEVLLDSTMSGEENWTHLNCGGYFAMNIFETGVLQSMDGKAPIAGLENFQKLTDVQLPQKTVRIVFFLTLNGRAIRQVYRLIKALFHERHYFYIHIDARQDYLFRELLVLNHKLPQNVKFMVNRKATIWGGASLLTVLLSGMEDLTNNAMKWGWEWDYVINLSESDFPLKSTEKLEHFLSVNIGKNFLKSHGRDVQKFIQKQGLDKTFDECDYRMWRLGDRSLPSGILIDGGSDWIALHKDFVEYVVKSDDELVSGLKGVFKQTLLPAESFFHTLLRNSKLCSTFVDNNLHVTNWKRKLGCKCQYKNVVDWCGCSPNDFRMGDWNRLQLTEPRLLFFGRKFEAIVSQGIINELETWLYPDRFEKHYPTIDSFWLSLYHHYDLSPKPDDGLVTLGFSLSRISSELFSSKFVEKDESDQAKRSGETELRIFHTNLLEISAYKLKDSLEGILVRYHLTIREGGNQILLNLETWCKIENIVEASSDPKVADLQTKLRDVRVGGDYDQKEQTFRNFAGALSPFSEPTLAYNVYTNESFNISIVWTDPFKSAQAVVNVTLTDGTTANFVKPTMKHPLTPGNWSVKIMTHSQHVLYTVKFLILPLELYQGNSLTSSDESWINGRAFFDETKSSQPLQEWIDELVSKFYKVQDFCLVDGESRSKLSKWNNNLSSHNKDRSEPKNPLQFVDISLCNHTQWSSLYPDPKSTITGIDAATGRLVP